MSQPQDPSQWSDSDGSDTVVDHVKFAYRVVKDKILKTVSLRVQDTPFSD